jgi:hypothetical protein
MVPADDFEFKNMIEQSSLKELKLLQSFPPADALPCFKRVFKEQEERKRGTTYAVFDPSTSTALVFREYRD